jgi:hypothetical protein
MLAYTIIVIDERKNIIWKDNRICIEKPSNGFLNRLSSDMGLMSNHKIEVLNVEVSGKWE